MERNYFVLISMSELKAEHARIETQLKPFCTQPPRQLWRATTQLGFGCVSEKSASILCEAAWGELRGITDILAIEIGPHWYAHPETPAARWLNGHVRKPLSR